MTSGEEGRRDTDHTPDHLLGMVVAGAHERRLAGWLTEREGLRPGTAEVSILVPTSESVREQGEPRLKEWVHDASGVPAFPK